MKTDYSTYLNIEINKYIKQNIQKEEEKIKSKY